VIDTLDALMDTDVKICAEINRLIHHNLLPIARSSRLIASTPSPRCFPVPAVAVRNGPHDQDDPGGEHEQGG